MAIFLEFFCPLRTAIVASRAREHMRGRRRGAPVPNPGVRWWSSPHSLPAQPADGSSDRSRTRRCVHQCLIRVWPGMGNHSPGQSVEKAARAEAPARAQSRRIRVGPPAAACAMEATPPSFTIMGNAITAASRHEARATRYRQLAAEYDARPGDVSSPFLCAQMRRTAEEYLVRAIGELRVAERQKQKRAG
jgi:hypothetical protein